MIGELGQTITVVNKSGKVVSTSKHLVNVFKEAKAAYRERKAELKTTRNAELEEKRARRALKAATIDDVALSRTSSKATKDARKPKKISRERPPVERGYSDSFCANDSPSTPPLHPPRSHNHHRSPSSPLHLAHAVPSDIQRSELTRRHTDSDALALPRPTPGRRRRSTSPHIDMDLAYGELPPPLPARRTDDEAELRGRMARLQQLLDEANCLQHSATAMIESLQKNPDALAAVALTLAEISNVVAKMAPGVLAGLKGSFPAVVALLASPQFLIAVGVGVGVTVVALGGYKIVKRIKAKRRGAEEEEEEQPTELREIETDVGKIESWRRGLAEAEAESIGTSIDGELVTPLASRRLIDEGVLKPSDLKSTKSRTRKPGKEKERAKAGKGKSKSKSANGPAGSAAGKGEKARGKKEPSGLRMLFQSHSKD